MKAAAIKINRYAREINIVNNNIKKNVLRGILILTVVLAICYAFIMVSMVFNIVERKSLEVNARNLSNEVGELELQYLTISKNVNLTLAESKGFKETSIKKFATRKSLGSISFAKNEL